MYERVLFPTDGSDAAAAGFEYALDVADEHGATVHVLHVADTNRDSVTRVGGDVVDALEEEGERIVSATADRADRRGTSVVTEVMQGDPHATIADYADEYGMDVVVMPTHGRRGVRRFLLGSVTERVINATSVPVVAVTPDEQRLEYPPGDVLVPTDGSPGAERALAEAVAIAKDTRATLHLLHVVDTASLGIDVRSAVDEATLEEQGRAVVDAARATAEAASLDDVTGTVAYGRVYREILSYVDESEVDLVAVGSHGETEFGRYTLGSVTAKIVRTSPVPVLMAGESVRD